MDRNNAGYTATLVACKRAGAVINDVGGTLVLGRSGGTKKRTKCDRWTDGRTDGPKSGL